MARTILVLGGGPAQLGLIEAAREHDLHVLVADRNPEAPGLRLAHEQALVSIEDESAIDRLVSTRRVDGVIAPGTDYPVAIAARVAHRHGLPHPLEPDTALAAISKRIQRERFAEHGVPQPRFRVCSSAAQAHEAATDVGYPCVVKPPDRQGQRGLSVASDDGALPQAVEDALAASRSGIVLLEELVRGVEVTVNAFSVDGTFHPLTVTERVLAAPPAFGVALAHVWPCGLPEPETAAIVDVAQRAAEAIGARDGPTYTQVLLSAAGPRVCELACRLGGGHDAELCEAALGVDLDALALRAALGDPVREESLHVRDGPGGACVRFLVPPVGKLESVEGVELASAREGVLWVRVYRASGATFGELRRGADRAGAALAVGSTREEALARAEGALETVSLVTS